MAAAAREPARARADFLMGTTHLEGVVRRFASELRALPTPPRDWPGGASLCPVSRGGQSRDAALRGEHWRRADALRGGVRLSAAALRAAAAAARAADA